MDKDTLINDLITEIKTRKTELENNLIHGGLEQSGSDLTTGKLIAYLEILTWIAENKTKYE